MGGVLLKLSPHLIRPPWSWGITGHSPKFPELLAREGGLGTQVCLSPKLRLFLSVIYRLSVADGARGGQASEKITNINTRKEKEGNERGGR